MTTDERAALISFEGMPESVTLLGGWDLDEKRVRKKIADAIRAAVAEEREACAKLADFWAGDLGQSPNHGQALRSGMKTAGREIAAAIRARTKPTTGENK